MKRNWIFGTLGIVVLMTVLLAFAKGGDHHHNNVEEQPVEQNDTPTATVEGEILDNHNDFACNLFRALFKREQGNSSIVVSPIGVGYLLGMLNDGADGKTRQQITDVLGLDGSVEEINEYFKMMMDATSGDDSRVTLRIANSIDINSQYSLIARYRTDMQRYYNAQCEALDFSDPSSLDKINNWCKSHTESMIPTVLDELDPDAVMYLLNAVYFKASWAQKCDPKETRDRRFTRQNGKTVKLPMMHLNTTADYGSNDLCKMIRLPYADDDYCMCILLPVKGKTMGDIISSLTAKKLVELQSQMTPCPVDILMPRFNIESETHLNDVLSTMGMPLAFASGAQFSNMVEGDNLYVGLIKQKAKIEVNEKGTKAAAVTVARMLKEEVVVEDHDVKFHANRPFVYYIVKRSTGSILFMGTYCGEGGRMVDSKGCDDDETVEDDEVEVHKRIVPKDGIYRSAEQMPQFHGGEAALMKYIQTHIKYPPTAAKNHVQGRVIVQFVVDKTGEIGEVKVVRSVDKDLDKEAIRVCKTLPRFTPGRQNGKIVPVWYTLPVNFKLPEK